MHSLLQCTQLEKMLLLLERLSLVRLFASLCILVFTLLLCKSKLPIVLWYCWLDIAMSIQPVKTWVVKCGRGLRYRWCVYGPADATAAPSSLTCCIHIRMSFVPSLHSRTTKTLQVSKACTRTSVFRDRRISTHAGPTFTCHAISRRTAHL